MLMKYNFQYCLLLIVSLAKFKTIKFINFIDIQALIANYFLNKSPRIIVRAGPI